MKNYPHQNNKLQTLLVYFSCKLTQHTLNTQTNTVSCNLSTFCALHFFLSLFECVAAYCKSVFHNSLQRFPFTHTSFIAWFEDPALKGCLSAILFLIIFHRFSMGYNFGLFPRQSSVAKMFFAESCFTAFER